VFYTGLRLGELMPNSEEEAAARLDEYLARASCAPVNTPAERISADHSGERDDDERLRSAQPCWFPLQPN